MEYLYLLVNSTMPDLVKFGYTKRNPHTRARELGKATGVAGDFSVVRYWTVSEGRSAEKFVFDRLTNYRKGKKEFLALTPSAAEILIDSLVKQSGFDVIIEPNILKISVELILLLHKTKPSELSVIEVENNAISCLQTQDKIFTAQSQLCLDYAMSLEGEDISEKCAQFISGVQDGPATDIFLQAYILCFYASGYFFYMQRIMEINVFKSKCTLQRSLFKEFDKLISIFPAEIMKRPVGRYVSSLVTAREIVKEVIEKFKKSMVESKLVWVRTNPLPGAHCFENPNQFLVEKLKFFRIGPGWSDLLCGVLNVKVLNDVSDPKEGEASRFDHYRPIVGGRKATVAVTMTAEVGCGYTLDEVERYFFNRNLSINAGYFVLVIASNLPKTKARVQWYENVHLHPKSRTNVFVNLFI